MDQTWQARCWALLVGCAEAAGLRDAVQVAEVLGWSSTLCTHAKRTQWGT